MKGILEFFLTTLSFCVVIPVVFAVCALVSWTLVFPFSMALLDAVARADYDVDFGEVFIRDLVWWLILPFTASLKAFRYTADSVKKCVGDALR